MNGAVAALVAVLALAALPDQDRVGAAIGALVMYVAGGHFAADVERAVRWVRERDGSTLALARRRLGGPAA